MSPPRRILPNRTYLVTRRCAFRQFLLRPSTVVNRIVTYCLGYAAMRTGVEVHVSCAMSNHWHLVVTDVRGRLPEFLRTAHQLISKCLNASMGRWENLWAAETTSVVELMDDEAILDKMVYVIANPTSAGLVRRPEQWPGVITTALGQELEARRPGVFFSADTALPDRIVLRCTTPPISSGASPAELQAKLAERVARRVGEIHAEMAERGEHFLGAKAVLARSPHDAPATREPRRKLSPRVATKNPSLRRRALSHLVAFWRAHRASLLRWRDGRREVAFPPGTYLMCVVHGASCARAG